MRFALARSSSISSVVRRSRSRPRHFVPPGRNGQGAILLPSYMFHPIPSAESIYLFTASEGMIISTTLGRGRGRSFRSFAFVLTCLYTAKPPVTEYIAFNGARQLQKGLSQVATARRRLARSLTRQFWQRTIDHVTAVSKNILLARRVSVICRPRSLGDDLREHFLPN